MKSYRELADKIFERRDKYLVARRRKKKKIIKGVSASLAALVVVFGLSAYHLEWFRPEAPTTHTQTGQDYYGPNGNMSGFEIILTTPTKAPTTTEKTDITTEKTDITTEKTTENKTTTIKWTTYTVTTTSRYEYKTDDKGVHVMHVDGDDVHYVHNNVYYIIDTNTGKHRKEFALPARPDEMIYRNGEIWTSYPTMKAILIYDYNTFELKRTIGLEHPITDFDVYGDYLIFTTKAENIYNYVYRYNMVTGEILNFVVDVSRANVDKFSLAGVLVSQERGCVYIGESRMSSSGLFCFDIETMEQISYYWAHGGIHGCTNDLFLVDDKIYWGLCEFDADDLSIIYWGRDYDKVRYMEYVDERFIYSMYSGVLYDRVTKEVVYHARYSNQADVMAVTESGNSFKYLDTSQVGLSYIYIVPGEYKK